MDFISEFFDDLISKVIPGFAIMYLVWWTDILCFYDKHKDILAVLVPLGFICGWLVGTIFELFTYALFWLIGDLLRKGFRRLSLSLFLNHWPPKISYDFLALTDGLVDRRFSAP
jgi:hypothetical protein